MSAIPNPDGSVRARRPRRHRRTVRIVCIAALVALTTALSACSTLSGQTSDAAAPVTSTETESSFVPKGDPPPSDGPAAQRGKTVWVVGCTQFEGCQRIMTGVQAAADSVGWTLKFVDAKADPTLAVKSINDAVAAKADGIIEFPLDCPVIKAGLLAAKAAAIPVLSWGGLDCDDPRFGGTDAPLFAAPVKFAGTAGWGEWYAQSGRSAADFVVKRARELGIANPSILQLQNTDSALNASEAEAFAAEIRAQCPECTLKPVDFTLAQVTSGKTQQIFRSAVLAHPDANVLYYAWDALLPAGLQNAINSSRGQFGLICCGDGGLAGYEQARANPGTWATNAYGETWAGWATVDVLNRVFAGETTFPDEGGVYLFVDSTHNMPPVGEYAHGPIDFAAAYRAVWNG
jgi:ribose transport system substrate-binding protein